MNFRYYIYNGESWVECGYNVYSKWNGKKYRSAKNVLDDLNSGKIKVEDYEKESKKKLNRYYASGMTLVEGKWQSCGWTIEAESFVEAAKIAEADKSYRIHSLSDNVMF